MTSAPRSGSLDKPSSYNSARSFSKNSQNTIVIRHFVPTAVGRHKEWILASEDNNLCPTASGSLSSRTTEATVTTGTVDADVSHLNSEMHRIESPTPALVQSQMTVLELLSCLVHRRRAHPGRRFDRGSR